jgi:hypothetical protein
MLRDYQYQIDELHNKMIPGAITCYYAHGASRSDQAGQVSILRVASRRHEAHDAIR